MKDSGKMICSMVLVKRFGQMVHNMRESIMKVKSMVKADIHGVMDLHMKVIGSITR